MRGGRAKRDGFELIRLAPPGAAARSAPGERTDFFGEWCLFKRLQPGEFPRRSNPRATRFIAAPMRSLCAMRKSEPLRSCRPETPHPAPPPHPTFADAKATFSHKGRRGARLQIKIGMTPKDAPATRWRQIALLKSLINLNRPPNFLQAFPNFFLGMLRFTNPPTSASFSAAGGKSHFGCHPGRLWSLWDMLKIDPLDYFGLGIRVADARWVFITAKNEGDRPLRVGPIVS